MANPIKVILDGNGYLRVQDVSAVSDAVIEAEAEDEDEDENEDENENESSYCEYCDESYDSDHEDHEICPWCDNSCMHNESSEVVIELADNGLPLRSVSVCEECYYNCGFWCEHSDERYDHDNFDVGVTPDGEDICVQYVTHLAVAHKYIELEPTDEDVRVFVLLQDFDPEKHTPLNKNQEKESSMYVDFYWKMPGKKLEASKLPVGGRILVLMTEEGGEVSSETSSTVKTLTTLIDERIKQAGADASDQNVANTYARIVLVEKGYLPKDYRL